MTKEKIKDLYSMKDILERYGLPQPNRAGFICCPFHKEKTASMKIYKKDFNCFGCGANGDIFTFVMLMDGLTFKEAFKALGGETDNSFSTRLKIYQAQKKREMKQKTEKKLKQKRELNYLLMDVYRKWLDRLEPLSEAWADTYNALQYQEYLWEVLNDPEQCYEVIGHIEL
ncbi:DNA primase [Lachnospiraceae bacterium]|nr:DNA primase [Lachnospiraceae bacterium]